MQDPQPPDPWDDVVTDDVELPGAAIRLLRPRDSMRLLDDDAFEHEEYLPYWADLWDSAGVLARWIAKFDLTGRRTVELGCGLGLPSIVAALRGADVLATDWAPDAVEFARVNAERNGARVRTAVCDWEPASVLTAGAPWDLVLASDVLYEFRNGTQLLHLLPQLVGNAGEVWLADPGRPHSARFFREAQLEWTVDWFSDAETPRIAVHRMRLL